MCHDLPELKPIEASDASGIAASESDTFLTEP
jgi:hypothetical protein